MRADEMYQNKQHKVIEAEDGGDICSCGEFYNLGGKNLSIDVRQELRNDHFEQVRRDGGKLVKQMIYLASPHTHTNSGIRDDRYKSALHCLSYFLERGFWMFSPIVHSHNLPMNQTEHTVKWETWAEFDTETITRMDEVWLLMIPGTTESKGVKKEVEIAKLQGKKIFTVWPVTDREGKKDYTITAFTESFLEDAKTL